MIKNISFVTKRYKWGWSIWIKADEGGNMLLASKLKSKYDVYKFLYNLNEKGVEIVEFY